MSATGIKLITLFKLGLLNVLRVLIYRLKCKLGIYRVLNPISTWPIADNVHFKQKQFVNHIAPIPISYHAEVYEKASQNQFCWYFFHWYPLPKTKPWHYDPFNHVSVIGNNHWSCCEHFSEPGHDIKNIWEQSRFYWLPNLVAACYYQHKDLELVNKLLQTWRDDNLPNQGVNWVCAQETSIRLINYILALQFLKQLDVYHVNFMLVHLKRITKTFSYAIAQQNNHATTEACAVIIAGCCLIEINHKVGLSYIKRGLRLLTKAVKRLVMPDGGFAQYSTTYHRLLLDSLSLTLLYLKKAHINIPSIISIGHQKAANWLRIMKMPETDDLINLGSNDGALLFNVVGHDYRDFSYSIDLAYRVIQLTTDNSRMKTSIFEFLTSKNKLVIDNTEQYDAASFGLVKMHNQASQSYGFLRYPNFNRAFRPCQSDLLHFDLWHKGQNVLIDSGTFSYNPNTLNENLKSVTHHNSVSFNHKEQMPILGRFLYGAWPVANVKAIDLLRQHVEIGYKDYCNNKHIRKIYYNDSSWLVIDELSTNAQLYFHLANLNWRQEHHKLIADGISIEVDVSHATLAMEVGTNVHSLYYSALQEHVFCVCTLTSTNKGAKIICKTKINFE